MYTSEITVLLNSSSSLLFLRMYVTKSKRVSIPETKFVRSNRLDIFSNLENKSM